MQHLIEGIEAVEANEQMSERCRLISMSADLYCCAIRCLTAFQGDQCTPCMTAEGSVAETCRKRHQARLFLGSWRWLNNSQAVFKLVGQERRLPRRTRRRPRNEVAASGDVAGWCGNHRSVRPFKTLADCRPRFLSKEDKTSPKGCSELFLGTACVSSFLGRHHARDSRA